MACKIPSLVPALLALAVVSLPALAGNRVDEQCGTPLAVPDVKALSTDYAALKAEDGVLRRFVAQSEMQLTCLEDMISPIGGPRDQIARHRYSTLLRQRDQVLTAHNRLIRDYNARARQVQIAETR